MKKIIITVILLVFVYFAQIFYIGKLNHDIFEKMIQNNSIYEVKNILFDKGFFTSKASFDVEFKEDLLFHSFEAKNLVSHVVVDFDNNIFASKNIQASFSNPYEILNNALIQKELAVLNLNIGFDAHLNLELKINNINLHEEGGNFLFKNAVFMTKLDKDMQMQNFEVKIDRINFSQFYNILDANDITYKEEFLYPIDWTQIFNTLREGTTQFSIEELNIDGFVFDKIDFIGDLKFNKDDEIFKGNSQLKIIHFALPKELSLIQDQFENIYISLQYDQISKQFFEEFANDFTQKENLLEKLLTFEPHLILNELSFVKNEKKFNLNGDFKGFITGYQVKLHAQSDVQLVYFFPALALLNIDSYFIEKDGKFMMDLEWDNTTNLTKIILNGNKIQSILMLD